MMEKCWTKEEDRLLIELHKNHTDREIAAILARSVRAIRERRLLLGIKKRGRPRLWSSEEEKQLVELYKTRTSREIAGILGRTPSVVLEKCHFLGLKKYPHWTDEEKKLLRELYMTRECTEIAKLLGRTVDGVRHQCKVLGLRKRSPLWTNEEINKLQSLYKTRKTLKEIALALNRTIKGVRHKAFTLGLKKRFKGKQMTKGLKGEEAARKIFKDLNWRVTEKPNTRSPFDFLIETTEGEKFFINVKYGKGVHLRQQNLKRLMNLQFKSAIFFITEDGTVAFMPIKIIQVSPQLVTDLSSIHRQDIA